MDKEWPKWIRTIPANPEIKGITICGSVYTLDSLNKTAILKKGFPAHLVVIPETVPFKGTDYLLVEISERAFSSTDGIEEIRIKGKNLIIRDQAFGRCTDLKKVIIDGHISHMGNSAFYHCDHLKDVIITGTVDSIGSNLFAYCTQLEQFVFPEGLSMLSRGMFKGCSTLKNILLPATLENVPKDSFQGCTSLEDVNLPLSVKEIGDYAFLDCKSLGSINFRKDVILGRDCFKRTPLDSIWRETHPWTQEERVRYQLLEEAKNNLTNGIVLSNSRSIYGENGFLLGNDDLLNVMSDFVVDWSYYGTINKRINSEARFIRLVENGCPIGKSARKMLLEQGVPASHIDNPVLWMNSFLEKNKDIPGVLAEAVRGLGIPVSEDTINHLAIKSIPTDSSWTDGKKNRWGNNYVCMIANHITTVYKTIFHIIHDSRKNISGASFFENRIYSYVYIVNILQFGEDVGHLIL